MTPADRLRAAVYEALPCYRRWQGCLNPKLDHPGMCPASHRAAVLAAVLPIVAELERAIHDHLEATYELKAGSGCDWMEHDIRLWESVGIEDPSAARATEADDEG